MKPPKLVKEADNDLRFSVYWIFEAGRAAGHCMSYMTQARISRDAGVKTVLVKAARLANYRMIKSLKTARSFTEMER